MSWYIELGKAADTLVNYVLRVRKDEDVLIYGDDIVDAAVLNATASAVKKFAAPTRCDRRRTSAAAVRAPPPSHPTPVYRLPSGVMLPPRRRADSPIATTIMVAIGTSTLSPKRL